MGTSTDEKNVGAANTIEVTSGGTTISINVNGLIDVQSMTKEQIEERFKTPSDMPESFVNRVVLIGVSGQKIDKTLLQTARKAVEARFTKNHILIYWSLNDCSQNSVVGPDKWMLIFSIVDGRYVPKSIYNKHLLTTTPS
jgi:hypothetical protein